MSKSSTLAVCFLTFLAVQKIDPYIAFYNFNFLIALFAYSILAYTGKNIPEYELAFG